MLGRESLKRQCFLKSKRRNMFYAAYCFNYQSYHMTNAWVPNRVYGGFWLNPSIMAFRHFSTTPSAHRPKLTDESVNSEAYISKYLEFSANHRPMAHQSILQHTEKRKEHQEEYREQLDGFNSLMEQQQHEIMANSLKVSNPTFL